MNTLYKPESAKSLMDATWLCILAVATITVVSMLPDVALAANPIEKTLCVIVNWFTGTIGRAVATIGLIVVGIGALMGKISWGVAIIVALGVAILFGAGEIIALLSPSKSGTACGA